MVQKRAGAGGDMDLLAGAAALQRVERLQRRPGLAQRVAESRKVVMPDKVAGTGTHRIGVEGWGNLPDSAAYDRRGRAAVQDAIKINPSYRR